MLGGKKVELIVIFSSLIEMVISVVFNIDLVSLVSLVVGNFNVFEN